MIRFDPVQKPLGFGDAAQRGSTWVAHNPNAARPKDLWSPFKSFLAAGFRNLCGYSVMYEPVGTVDHFVSWHEDKARAYDWSNYRYASAWINSSKRSVGSGEILDPFEVGDDWFEILLPSLQLVVSDGIPDGCRKRAEFALQRLHLRDDERVLRQRREWYRMYQEGELTLEGLRKKAPLIAKAAAGPNVATGTPTGNPRSR
jgi:hypothetical protein